MKKIICLATLCMCLLLASCGGKKQNYLDKGYTSVVEFNFNGGILTNAVTDIENSIKYAYEPNNFICDPVELPSSVLRKKGYDFIGWYKDEACEVPWDFKRDKIQEENITLYAKWKTSINYTYTLCYVDEDTKEEKSLYTYEVEANEKFSDFLSRANTRENYTAYGFFKDPELQTPWDDTFTHPGGAESLDVKIYIRFIKGTYNLVSTYDDLVKALKSNANIYLLNSIDCEGKTLSFAREFQNEIQGNHFTISNFKIAGPNRLRAKYSIFESLLDGTKIENVTFDNVVIEVAERSYYELRLAGLAGVAEGNVEVNHVHIANAKIVLPTDLSFTNDNNDSLTIVTDQAVYEGSQNVKATDFTTEYIIEDN
ncbi:MAG: InlB B-repeat-containing protein, partial [Anaeroplasmataceae bacterium]|nr:InlB B-repeat-containing protein [Anaeroplasmataceae bacterium]